MIRGELFEPRYRLGEIHLARKVKRRIQQRAPSWHDAFGDCDSMERRPGVDTKPDGEINGITSEQTPLGEVQSLLEGVACFARTADEKNPERLDAVAFNPLGDFSHLGGIESLLELGQHRIAGALGSDAQGLEARSLHCRQKLGRRRSRRKVGLIELNPQVASRNCLAYLERVSWRRVESGIDEIEMVDPRLCFQLLDLVGDELRIARAISPAFDVAIGAVDAFVHAATLRLNGNGRSISLIPGEIDPAMEAWRGQGVKIRVLTRRSEYDGSVLLPDNSWNSLNGAARSQGSDEGHACALAVSGDRVVDRQIAEQGFRSDAERSAASDDFRLGSGRAQSAQDFSGLRSVVLERDCIAVVDVAYGHADDIGTESLSDISRPTDRVTGEAGIEKSDVVSSRVERGGHARQTVWNDWVGLSLAIGADEQHPGCILCVHFKARCH